MISDATVTTGTRTSWVDRCIDWRDRLLTSAAFRRWALRFPLTRPIARRRARALFDLCAGFVYSQILSACLRLGLFEALANEPLTEAALSYRLGLPAEATARLLAAAVSLKLVSRRSGQRFGLGPLGVALVDNPGVAGMIRHHALLYDDLRDPVALLRGAAGETELGRYWGYATAHRPGGLSSGAVDSYTRLMAASQAMIAAEILDAYRFDRHRCLLDIGGGDGSFLREVAARASTLSLMLFDLPAVADRAHEGFAAAGLSARAQVFGGDFKTDALPEGADIVSLVRVLHDHDDESALTLLSAVRRALPEGGTLLIAEPMSGTPGAEPIGDAYFGFYLLAMRSGRPRTPAEISSLLVAAGFTRVGQIATNTPFLARLITART